MNTPGSFISRSAAQATVIRAILGGLLSVTMLGCGSSDGDGAATETDAGTEVASADAGPSDTTASDAATDSSAPPSDVRTDTPPFDTSAPPPGMPLVSGGVPAFASVGTASAANDTNPASSWGTSATSAWLAYDLSAVPVAKRQRALVAWDSIHAGCYIDETSTGGQRPLAYAIESNSAPGGGSAPTSGWTSVVTIAANRYCARHHLLELAGANWVRMNVTKSTPDGVALDLAIYSAPDGATDSWLFMGDSITYMTMTYAFCDLPALVHAAAPDHWPAVLDGALGGTNTVTAVKIIDDTMKDFPGRFVVLAYGTNDGAGDFRMKELVEHVIAAGKVPVVPRMIWSSGSPQGEKINAIIDALYVSHPEIVRGPDLWKGFEGHTEWIPVGDIHPNGAGQAELRKQWAAAMAAMYH